ncbi:MAG TPA: hypothetical protein VKU01_06850 [Bryobacteraceae bacterium]|nr:hypothetical protein [Bryobacteraceae bacterium]
MQYKTIVHELLQQRTELHEQLRLTRRLLPTIEACARELKASHEEWKETLSQARPGSHPIQIASEAMEIAVKELQDHLQAVSDDETLSLDAAMAFLRNPTSRG